jgi:hypothetical protein
MGDTNGPFLTGVVCVLPPERLPPAGRGAPARAALALGALKRRGEPETIDPIVLLQPTGIVRR